ncbi:response regulator [Maribellus comscasis]|uniref:Response regulator n=1 Tax=Maribellus comscasis TaxID=2681766 RepID=A0A6I6JRL4_9BACT|nr:response regulator [Maribellus comscasis]QGY45665.1 response regulator [Maribellus comscasis]
MKKIKILYVDDDPAHILLMCRVLLESNFELVPACSAKDAISILNNSPELKIVISDWVMPEMDGLELVQYVNESYPDKICYMLSGSNRTDKVKNLEEKGFIRKYFPKPVNKEILMKEMDNISSLLNLN